MQREETWRYIQNVILHKGEHNSVSEDQIKIHKVGNNSFICSLNKKNSLSI